MVILNPISRRRKRNGRSPGGFTLIELMVVIAIIGIVASITIPWLLNPERRVKKVARELIGDMQQTRINAVKQNQNWRIDFHPDSNSYDVVDTEGADPERVVKTVRFTSYAEGVGYGDGCGGANLVSYNGNSLTLNPRGTCNAGYAYLKYRDVSYRVGTLATGVIRIQRCTGGTWK